MRVFLTLLRRELAGFFVSLNGYVVIASVLFLLGLSFSSMLDSLSTKPTDAPVTEIFFVTMYFWLILLLTFPVMTMKAFAMEKFTGTYETLMTAPVGDLQVVFAKFFGALIFYLITWLPLLAYLFIVRRYSNDPSAIDPYVVGSTFLGMLLVGSVFISIGCFASALTRSQIIAAILSYALGLALFLLSLRSLFSEAATGWEALLFKYISMSEHMEDFARGVVDTRYLVFYLSITTIFLFLTHKAVESRRWR